MLEPALHLPPAVVGIGLRGEHHVAFDAARPAVGFVEVHSENYFGRGGRPLHYLENARRDYPVSLHGVGLSIGSSDGLDRTHLQRLAALVQRIEPTLVSEHLSWSALGGIHANDLLPLPCTEEALTLIVSRVHAVQDFLRRPILLENLSSYLQYAGSAMPEWTFLGEVVRATGCGLLLVVNIVYVSACNHGFDASAYLRGIPAAAVQEIHLAGFVRRTFDDGEILVDTHSQPVADAVWALYREALALWGPRPTLIEWDHELPPLPVLVGEATKAAACIDAAAATAERCDAFAA
jgi:uncharacterized protein (UPF0276 family)